MSYLDEPYRRRQPYALIILLMFLSALLGGFVSYAVAPSIFGSKNSSGYTQDQQSNDISQDEGTITVPIQAKSPVVAIAQKVGPAVVGITNFKGSNFFMEPVESSGTGFILDGEKGYIVTNYHVVAGARRLMVSLSEDEQYSAQIVGRDARTDLAVIKINANRKLPEVVLGDSSKLQVGEEVVAIGNPLGREFARSVTKGVVSALNREITIPTSSGGEITLKLIQTDAAINPGNSGGPLVNMQGQVVGINSAKIAQEGVEGMGFAIPINVAKPIIQQIIEKGYVSRPFIGIYNFREITEEMSQWYDIPRGIFVGGVVPGSPADKAGIQPEDIIVEFDGKRITTFADLDEALSKHKVGDRVKIGIVRDGKRREFNLTLGEMPRNE
ncbi:MAG TPA: serine protease Do [Peptococcaceae bacterium]|nr:MAG: Serine protease Do [Clostridia bacterium 41_269]HBT19887.1 serine protease Do [Peptococcaceae bacterium]